MAIKVYTKHGLRAHYMATAVPAQPLRARTFCGHDVYGLNERSRLFRRRLVRASVCAECDEGQNVADAAR